MRTIEPFFKGKTHSRFDFFLKMLISLAPLTMARFFLRSYGYNILSAEPMPIEVRSSPKRVVDVLLKAAIELEDEMQLEVYIQIEFQHTNDRRMLVRVFDYREAISDKYNTEMIFPIEVYTGEHPLRMKQQANDQQLGFVRVIPAMQDITQMEPESITEYPDDFVRFLCILNHKTAPEVQANILFKGLQTIFAQKGMDELIIWYDAIINITTNYNYPAMTLLEELMQIYPEVVKNSDEGVKLFYKRKYEDIAKAAKAAEKKGKLEGKLETRIESAYLMMTKAGMSFEGASAVLSLTELEQEMLRQRMAQNGH